MEIYTQYIDLYEINSKTWSKYLLKVFEVVPMAVVTAIKGIVLGWIREDRSGELDIALQKSRAKYG